MLNKTVCELFAGVGGFRLGLERSSKDWNTVWANQWEPGRISQHAFDCYCYHFGSSANHVNKDISTIPKDLIPDHNLLVGGFPCQDYSVARSGAKGINGIKGVLWWEIRDILEVKRPKFVLLENVDRLLKSPSKQRGRDFSIMLSCFNNLGYRVEWRVINAAEYGFAQRRRRIFIFAYHQNTTFSITNNDILPSDIVTKEGFFAKVFPVSHFDDLSYSTLPKKSLADISDTYSYDFSNSGHMINGNICTCKTIPKYEDPTPISVILESNPNKKYYLGKNLEKWQYLKGAKKIERTSKNGHSYVFSEGQISFPDSIDKPARTMLTSETSLNRSTHVIEDPTTHQLRLLTPIEAERLQGFDDNWTNTGMPEKFRYFCMGNALVVGLIEKMGYSLKCIFSTENPL